MLERRRALDGLAPPPGRAHEAPARAPRRRARSTSCSPARASRRRRPPRRSPACCATCCRDPQFGPRVVPIIPDEARTFGMDALFKEFEIYASQGQQYEPVDHALLLSYSESQSGQILEEGITEAGSMASFIAAGTALRHPGRADGAVLHLLLDVRLPAGGRPHLAGQRRPGPRASCSAPPPGAPRSSARASSTRTGTACCWPRSTPPIEAYDPAFAYEVATIVRDGLRRMYVDERGRPLLPDPLQRELGDAGDARRRRGGHRRGPLPLGRRARGRRHHPATILFSGTGQPGRPRRPRPSSPSTTTSAPTLYSATSYKRLREEALSTERWNRLHPTEPARDAVRHRAARRATGPIVAVTDFMKAVPDQIARWVPAGALHAARHRRLRAQRHPRGAAPPLRGRRRPHRRRHARRPRRGGRRQGRGRRRRHRPLRPRPRARRPPPRLSHPQRGGAQARGLRPSSAQAQKLSIFLGSAANSVVSNTLPSWTS